MTDLAVKKLQGELKTAKTDRYGSIMKDDVCKALIGFCRQDAEFAQAVYQGGSFADCMKAVAKNCGHGISDLEAYRRAVQFYFQGADIRYTMTVNLCAGVEKPEEEKPEPKAVSLPVQEKKGAISLDLSDFL
jgi:hypothetical protein